MEIYKFKKSSRRSRSNKRKGVIWITLNDVMYKQPKWFSESNRQFFNDKNYFVKYGRSSNKPYLVRSTYAWTDMFGGKKQLHYRINILNNDLTIGALIDDSFDTMEEVEEWLKDN